MTDDDLLDAGDKERRAVLGDAHVDRASSQTAEFGAEFQAVLTRYAWGSVWTRQELTRHERRLLTIALLAALGRHEELAVHARSALEAGVTRAVLEEVLIHTAVYAGLPAANSAVTAVRAVLEESAGAGTG